MWAFVRVGPLLAVPAPERLLFVFGTGMAAGGMEASVDGCMAVSHQSADEPAQQPAGQQDQRDEDGHRGNGAGQPRLQYRLVKVVGLDGGSAMSAESASIGPHCSASPMASTSMPRLPGRLTCTM